MQKTMNIYKKSLLGDMGDMSIFYKSHVGRAALEV